jgi:hypothetical protein
MLKSSKPGLFKHHKTFVSKHAFEGLLLTKKAVAYAQQFD